MASSLTPFDLAAEFSALAPWVYKFRVRAADYGGTISAAEDERIAQFFAFAPNAKRILELGALEGAQTALLAERASEIIAIEGRAANIRKAELVKRVLRIENAHFVEANLETADLASFGKFDAVFCSGLLYHLPEPWKLIEQAIRVAPRLFIWTHYADEISANEFRQSWRGKVHREGGPNEPLSGLSETAFWPTLGSLLSMLTTSGFHTLTILKHEPTHQNSPAVTIGASAA